MSRFLEVLSQPIAVAAITGIPSFLLGRLLENTRSKRKTDTATYQYLKLQLPTFRQTQYFFHETSLTDSFSTDTFHKFGEAFEALIDNPEHHFLNRDLQECVVRIAAQYREMASVVAIQTFPVHDNEQSIRRLKYGDEIDDMATGELLNRHASKIYESFTEFLKKAKKRLHISPELTA